MKMTVGEFAADARKAIVVAGAAVTSAVGVGVLDSAQAGAITGVLGALLAALVYLVPNNGPSTNKGTSTSVTEGTSTSVTLAAPAAQTPAPGSSPTP